MSVEETLAERGKRYGDFTDHAKLCQDLKAVMQNFAPASWTTSAPWLHLSDVQKQALEVIADKIARILSGDPNYADNWHDIQGYAKLVEDRLPGSMPADCGQQHQLNTASFTDGGFTGRGCPSRMPTGGVMIHCPDCSADSCPCVSR